jgi:hypothetical protein
MKRLCGCNSKAKTNSKEVNGRRQRVSTRTSDFRTAQKIYAKAQIEAALGRWSLNQPGVSMTFGQIAQRYMAEHPLEVYFSVGMGHFGFVFVWDLFSHGEWLSGIFTCRLRFLFPLLSQKRVTTASIISPATKPSTAPRRVAQNQPQPKVIPVSFISVPLFSKQNRRDVTID